MAWIRQPGCVAVTDSTGPVAWLRSTSLSTINLGEWDPSSKWDVLRMYGVVANDLASATNEALGSAYGSDTFAAPGTEPYICYLDSTMQSDGEHRLVAPIDVDSIVKTDIPNHRDATAWYFTQVVYGGGQLNYDETDPCLDASEVEETSDQQGASLRRQNMMGSFSVNYKDPCVLKLPDGRWLMLLTRVRACAVPDPVPDEEPDETPPPLFPRGPDELSDIVAYLAPDPSFTTGLTGPFWMCVNIGSLGPGSEGVRFWLSVAGGAVIDTDTLAVYFVAEWTEAAMGVCGTEAEIDAVATSLAWLDRISASRFVQTLGVKRIPIAEFDVMAGKTDYFDESKWANSANGGTFQMPGDESPLYIWKYESDGKPREEAVNVYPYHKLVDPQCTRCSFTPDNYALADVRLFTAAMPWQLPDEPVLTWAEVVAGSPASLDGGLRIAKPVLETADPVTRRDGGSEKPVAGIDFMFIERDPFEIMQVTYDKATLTATLVSPIDPDPVLMGGDLSWRVDFGVQTSVETATLRTESTTLEEDRSERHDDVCGDGSGEALLVAHDHHLRSIFPLALAASRPSVKRDPSE